MSLLAVGGLHLFLLALLVSTQVAAVAPATSGTLTVRVIQPEVAKAPALVPARPKPAPLPPPPKPVAPTPQPLLAAPTEAPSPAAPAPVAKETPPPVAEVKAAAPAAPPQAPVAAAPLAAPAPLVAPRFDADYLQNPHPTYPRVSRRLQEEGKVVLRVHVEANGRPGSIEVRTSSGSARLDNAALEAVRQWQFVPARRGAEAVDAWVLVPISFSLRG